MSFSSIVPTLDPSPGTHVIRHRGGTITFSLALPAGADGEGWLRTNLGNAETQRTEIINHVERDEAILKRDWHDMPMERIDGLFRITLPLTEVGRFEAKAFYLPHSSDEAESPKPVWPSGGNVIIKVEPADYCGAASIYCAFVRLFGENQSTGAECEADAPAVARLEASGYEVIPRSGKFRDVIAQLDHIVYGLGFRIIQLLPIFPTPTTYARMGRFGSPFAALDFTNIDPALADFDRKTTPLDQFRELVDEAHRRDAKIFLDIPINHTGWASWLQIHHPEWFHRHEDNETFVSPGAWGVTWADLSKLDYDDKALWRYMADVFLFWCRKGVDGFRCDAGYMVPIPLWKYVTAKVRREFPDTAFLLEGLGGEKSIVFQMLDEANLDWAYSELFQNEALPAVSAILEESIAVSATQGIQIHFAETHDNNRLAAKSMVWSRMRTALSALCSHSGGYGITCGVEWFADQKIDVHRARSLSWGNPENQISAIRRLNSVLAIHPAFHDGARLSLSAGQGNDHALVLLRHSSDGGHPVLVLANLDVERETVAQWDAGAFPANRLWDLLTGNIFAIKEPWLLLAPGECRCLSAEVTWLPQIEDFLMTEGGEPARIVSQRLRAKVLEVRQFLAPESCPGSIDIVSEAAALAEDPSGYCAMLTGDGLPRCVRWRWPEDVRRTVMWPPGSVLLLESENPFSVDLRRGGCEADGVQGHEQSIPSGDRGHFALLIGEEYHPQEPRIHELIIAVFLPEGCRREIAKILILPDTWPDAVMAVPKAAMNDDNVLGLCANGRGALAQVQGIWGDIRSQYDAMLAANPHPDYPVDRRILLTRCRAWAVCRDYSTELNIDCQTEFSKLANVVRWEFSVPVGMGKHIMLECTLRMAEGKNAIELGFHRRSGAGDEAALDDRQAVRLIVRPDIEDRDFHHKTKAHAGPEKYWPIAVTTFENGFDFSPGDCVLQMRAPDGAFVSEPEWHYMVAHPVDAERGLDGSSDLFSPGYFTLELCGGKSSALHAHLPGEDAGVWQRSSEDPNHTEDRMLSLEEAARRAISDFIVKRDDTKTVIAGYPWFLDWGRDTLICLRGIIAAGMLEDARDILRQFARYEKGGTLPNMIRGGDDSNRDTSDAQLWFFTACSDLLRAEGSDDFLQADCGDGRSIKDVLESLANGYLSGTANGIRVDAETGLVFSPSHFTWMDTNYPAATPREGYPIEIQALWHAALVFLHQADPDGPWDDLAGKVAKSIVDLFWDEPRGFLSDCLHAAPGQSAVDATPDDHLRSNQLFAITLGAVSDRNLCRAILTSSEELLVPGAIRTLADRPVAYALPVRHHHGHLLNDPHRPYWGRYGGDEDTRRKPAYHNGTAWTWPFPSYAEALGIVYGDEAHAVARSILSSSALLFNGGCLGHLPEIINGDTPHEQRGCVAQAWSVTELYRVLRLFRDGS
jgi:starch synthase (maltosyl-transferring)